VRARFGRVFDNFVIAYTYGDGFGGLARRGSEFSHDNCGRAAGNVEAEK